MILCRVDSEHDLTSDNELLRRKTKKRLFLGKDKAMGCLIRHFFRRFLGMTVFLTT